MKNESARVWIESPPTNPDPLFFDTTAHHILYRPVLSGLVSTYKVDEVTPVIAKRWNVQSNGLVWNFELHEGLRFSNGDPITATSVVKSWTRLGYVLKARKSQSDFFSALEDYENITTPSSKFKGLSALGENVVSVRLKRPLPALLELISFGLYSIVHESNYHASTGAWKDGSNVISSGFYEMRIATNGWQLRLRDDFLPEVRHVRAFKTILITTDPHLRSSADLILGSNIETTLEGTHKFHGGPATNIAYIYCLSWKNPESPCFEKAARQFLRKKFLDKYSMLPADTVKSFFPLAMQDVWPIDTDAENTSESPSLADKSLTVAISKSRNPFLAAFADISNLVSAESGLHLKKSPLSWDEFDQIVSSNFVRREFDLAAMYTGIQVDNPLSDIRFMFNSKEGIRLPDEDGSIIREIESEVASVQRINQAIWDQAIVWPIGHFSLGMWAQPHLDFSLINLLLPPTALHLIGQVN